MNTSRYRTACGLLLALACTGTALAQGTRLAAGQVLWNAETAGADERMAAEALADAVLGDLHSGRPEAAVARLQASGEQPLRQHWALHEVLKALESAGPQPAAEAVLAFAAAQPVRVLRQHEETAAAFFLPMFDPAAAAADVRRAWAIEAQRERFRDLMGKAAVLPDPGEDAIAEAGLLGAIDDLPEAQVARLAAVMAKRPLRPAVALALARRSGDGELAARLLTDADAALRLAAFDQVLPRLPAPERVKWLQRLEADAALASAATLALLPELIAGGDIGAILQRLADPALGPTAAAALAGHADALRWIDQLWTQSTAVSQRRMLLLALTLHDSDAARARRQVLQAQQEAQP